MAETNQSQVISKISESSQAVAAYWTPERMREATPLDFPQVEEKNVKKISMDELKKRFKDQVSLGSDGAPPTIEIQPNHKKLFEPILQSTATTPLDVGTLNEFFTSGQLTPQTASGSYPYRTVGKLFFTTPGGNKTCSATVIRARIVMTAGHCVHNGNGASTGWYTNFMFIPAYSNGSAPYHTWSYTYVATTNQWFTGGGTIPNVADYGMFEIADQSINGTLQMIGSVTGYLGWQSGVTMPNHAFIIGYPNSFDNGQLMHQVASASAQAVAPNNAEYGSDMGVGSGGSAWIQNFGSASAGQNGGSNPGRNRIIGVTSYGYSNPASLANGSSIFDSNFISLINFICGHQSGNC